MVVDAPRFDRRPRKPLDSSAIIALVEALDVIELLAEIPSTSWREDSPQPWRRHAGQAGMIFVFILKRWGAVDVPQNDQPAAERRGAGA